jgi:excisionase family DNA binding protein
MTISQTANYLRCSKSYVLALVQGKVQGAPPLPSAASGRTVTVSKPTLNAWLWELEARQRQEVIRRRARLTL